MESITPISEQCFDLAVGLLACADSTLEDCGKILQLVKGLEAELDAARADLREAVKLLNAASPNMGDAEWDEWGSKVNKLLAKHNKT